MWGCVCVCVCVCVCARTRACARALAHVRERTTEGHLRQHGWLVYFTQWRSNKTNPTRYTLYTFYCAATTTSPCVVSFSRLWNKKKVHLSSFLNLLSPETPLKAPLPSCIPVASKPPPPPPPLSLTHSIRQFFSRVPVLPIVLLLVMSWWGEF